MLCSEHVSDVMTISQAFTAISSRITGTVMVRIKGADYREAAPLVRICYQQHASVTSTEM